MSDSFCCQPRGDLRCAGRPSRSWAGTASGAAMRRFRWVPGVVVLGLAGALAGVIPSGAAVPARARCRTTAFVANGLSGTVSTIDVKTRTKDPTDITVGTGPYSVAVTSDGKTAFVTNASNTVSTLDVKTRTKRFADWAVASNTVESPNPGTAPGVAATSDGTTAFVANDVSDTVSTLDVKTRTKNPTDIPVGAHPNGVAVTPDGKTAFVTDFGSDSVSTINVKTRTKDPTDIPVGAAPGGVGGVAVTPDGKTVYVTNQGSDTVSTIDVKTRSKDPTDITVGTQPVGIAITPEIGRAT